MMDEPSHLDKPLTVPRGECADTEGAANRKQRKLHILVAADNLLFRKAMIALCEGAGLNAIAAQNGILAREILDQDEAFDVVVTEAMMMKMGGWQLVRQIWENPRFARTLVVFMYRPQSSGNDHRQQLEYFRQLSEENRIRFVRISWGYRWQRRMAKEIVSLILEDASDELQANAKPN